MIENLNLRTWAEIDLDAVENNFHVLSSILPENTKKMVVLKADGYGHGAVALAKLLEDKTDYIGVARVDEAVEMRLEGVKKPRILVLGHTSPVQYGMLFKYDIIPTVYSFSDAEILNKCAKEKGKVLDIHIAIDTGMSRIGFELCDESLAVINEINNFEGLNIEGIFSHFADADNGEDRNFTLLQLQRFRKFSSKLSDMGVNIPIRHIANSAAITELESEFEMVREGIYLYGLAPSETVNLDKVKGLRPAMSLRAEIVHVHTLEEGTPVSYGCTYVTRGTRTIATVCAGYADGVPRLLSNKGCVLVNGRRAPIVGRVCMDQFMIDVTDIVNVKVGSVATIIGRDGWEDISAFEVAKNANTISYEVICGISKRVPRVYFKSGGIFDIYYGIPHEEE